MIGRDGGNAEIERLARDFYLDAAVLRKALLRDAHRAGHDLESADDGGLQTLRWRLHFLQDAIDAEADAEFFLERLEMNVAGAEAMRFDQKHRDHANDGRVRFIASGQLAAFGDLEADFDLAAEAFLQNVRRLIRRAVIFDQRFADHFRAAAHQFDLALEQEAEAVDRIDIERITHRDDEAGIAERDRDDLETARVFRADLLDDIGRNEARREIDPIHVRLRGERARDVGLGENPIFYQDGDDFAGAIGACARFGDLRVCDQPNVLEDSEHILIVLGQNLGAVASGCGPLLRL